jgi:hypothetical protein
MKKENLYKFGLSLFSLWQIYYSYWWFAIHKTIKRYEDYTRKNKYY